jgi:hypothetical protein
MKSLSLMMPHVIQKLKQEIYDVIKEVRFYFLAHT